MNLPESDLGRYATDALQEGNLSDAERLCKEALRQQPDDYRSLVLLAVIHRQKSEYLEAAGIAEKAMRLRPNVVEAYYQLALNMESLGRSDLAARALVTAIKLRPEIAEFHLHLGLSHTGMGNLAAAKASFAECLRIDPNHLQARLCIVSQLLIEDNMDSARTHAEAAIRMAPDSVAARLAMAEVRLAEDESEMAQELIDQALILDPKSATGLNMLGFRQSQRGHFEDAESSFKKSMELSPIQGLAYLGLTQTRKFSTNDLPLLSRMKTLQGNGILSAAESSSLHFALAKAYDDIGEFELAMRCYDEAQRCASRSRFGTSSFDPDSYQRSMRLIRDCFPASAFNSPWGWTVDSSIPILIVGMIRSGTTLVEQILSSHPDVGAAGEHPYWKRHCGRAELLAELATNPEKCVQTASDYVTALRKVSPNTARVTDKLPGNYLRLGLIHQALPNAKFIHCRRNPLDIALSIYVTPNRSAPSFSHSKEGIVFAYRQYLELMDHWRQVLPPSSLHEIQYEELVHEPRSAIARMLEYCGLNWNEACVHPETNTKEVLTPSLWQVRQPIYRSSVKRWTHYEPWLGAFRELMDIA